MITKKEVEEIFNSFIGKEVFIKSSIAAFKEDEDNCVEGVLVNYTLDDGNGIEDIYPYYEYFYPIAIVSDGNTEMRHLLTIVKENFICVKDWNNVYIYDPDNRKNYMRMIWS